MMMSAGSSFMSERLHHPSERLMMMSAMILKARTATFDDDFGETSFHERAVGPPERASDDDVGAELDGFGDDVGGASLHQRAAAPPERASDDDVGGEFDGQRCDF